jgi:hypothetical protein
MSKAKSQNYGAMNLAANLAHAFQFELPGETDFLFSDFQLLTFNLSLPF